MYKDQQSTFEIRIRRNQNCWVSIPRRLTGGEAAHERMHGSQFPGELGINHLQTTVSDCQFLSNVCWYIQLRGPLGKLAKEEQAVKES
jgi:hypothetical protein